MGEDLCEHYLLYFVILLNGEESNAPSWLI